MNIIELLLKCDPGWCCECSSAGLDLVTADCPPSPRQCARYSRAQYYSLPPAARFLPSVSISRYLYIYISRYLRLATETRHCDRADSGPGGVQWWLIYQPVTVSEDTKHLKQCIMWCCCFFFLTSNLVRVYYPGVDITQLGDKSN